MKANELTIGDLILAQFINGDRYARIAAIAIDCVVVSVSDREYEHDYESIFPIPLTEDILKANGFIKVNSQRYDLIGIVEGNDFHVQANPKKGHIFVTNHTTRNHCNKYDGFFVHELQHALRLCGLNELANNFKVE